MIVPQEVSQSLSHRRPVEAVALRQSAMRLVIVVSSMPAPHAQERPPPNYATPPAQVRMHWAKDEVSGRAAIRFAERRVEQKVNGAVADSESSKVFEVYPGRRRGSLSPPDRGERQVALGRGAGAGSEREDGRGLCWSRRGGRIGKRSSAPSKARRDTDAVDASSRHSIVMMERAKSGARHDPGNAHAKARRPAAHREQEDHAALRAKPGSASPTTSW